MTVNYRLDSVLFFLCNEYALTIITRQFMIQGNVLSSTELPIPGRPHQKITISFEEVTPHIAKRWLESNEDRQRKMNLNQVYQYVNQMKKGLWIPDTGESVKFSASKRLIDGQHRLQAIVDAEEPRILMIMRGIADENIVKMDQGKKRNLADIFKIQGIDIPKGFTESMLASVINGLFTAKYFIGKSQSDRQSLRIDSRRGNASSPSELYEFVIANPIILEKLAELSDFKIATIAKNVPIGPTIVGWFLANIIDKDIATQILKTFEECVPQTEKGRNCPAFVFFQYIQRARSHKMQLNKHEFPGFWLWTVDNMILNTQPKRFMVSQSHMPGQGHEGTRDLINFFKDLKEVS